MNTINKRRSRKKVAGSFVSVAALVAAALGLFSQPALSAFPGANGMLLIDGSLVTSTAGGVEQFSLQGADAADSAWNFDDAADSAWSPDGTKIVFIAGDSLDTKGVYVANADGTGVRMLVGNNEMSPFAEGSGWFDYYTPAWSPGGDRILFAAAEGLLGLDLDIFVVDANGGNLTRFRRPDLHEWNPVWSPDGQQIAFQSTDQGHWEIFLMDASGSNIRNLTNSPTFSEGLPDWSPDGRRLLYTSFNYPITQSHHVLYEPGTVTAINADGSAPQALAEGYMAKWAPDGTKVAFITPEEEVRVIGVGGSDFDFVVNTQKFTTGSDDLSWQPCPADATCDEVLLRHATKIGLSQKLVWRGSPPTKPAIRVTGSVKPARSGAVNLALQARRNGRWRTTISKHVALDSNSAFKAVLAPSPALSGVPCRVRARSVGNATYAPGEKTVGTVAC